jgi:hypothetical protein
MTWGTVCRLRTGFELRVLLSAPASLLTERPARGQQHKVRPLFPGDILLTRQVDAELRRTIRGGKLVCQCLRTQTDPGTTIPRVIRSDRMADSALSPLLARDHAKATVIRASYQVPKWVVAFPGRYAPGSATATIALTTMTTNKFHDRLLSLSCPSAICERRWSPDMLSHTLPIKLESEELWNFPLGWRVVF